MNLEVPWDANRWRTSTATPSEAGVGSQHYWNNQHHLYGHEDSRHQQQPLEATHHSHAPQLSAPRAVHATSQNAAAAILDESNNPSWMGIPRETDPKNPSSINLPRLTDASIYPSQLYEGSQSPYSSYRPSLITPPPRETYAGTWRGLHHHDDRRSNSSHVTDAPHLTLHIPQPQTVDRPRIVPGSNTLPSETQTYGSQGNNCLTTTTPSTSLPSFATIQEHAARPNEDADGPEIAPMSSRLSCNTCTDLRPLVRDIAGAVAELDDHVQTHCNKGAVRVVDIPYDDPVKAVQFILQRLRNATADLQDSHRRNQFGFYNRQQSVAAAQNLSPPNPLKRAADQWDRDDHAAPKRPKSGISAELPFQLPAYTPREDRRASIDFAVARDSRIGYSPQPTESAPESAYPRQISPILTNRLNARALPSPSSLAYPPSAAPSLPPPTVQSMGSPATSYQPASIHTASTNSVTSAHIADLQHQVTLKSLALQTLQAEYASLLQKLQRESVKRQTIEKKTNVADQEVNELTGKNEELADQVKSLESQLDESERKRDAERSDAARDKEQWGRMLENGGRLHAKLDNERQKLLEEKAALEQRIAKLEGKSSVLSGAVEDGITATSKFPSLTTPNVDLPRLSGSVGKDAHFIRQGSSAEQTAAAGAATESSGDFGHGSETASLRHEIFLLNGRIQELRYALEGVRRHNRDLEDQARRVLEHTTLSDGSIDRALQNDDCRANSTKISDEWPSTQKAPSNRSTPSRQKPAWSPHVPGVAVLPLSSQTAAKTSKLFPPGTLEIISDGKRSTALISEVARAVSPGPEELGIQITPSSSSPEELIRALGPVPSPVTNLQGLGQGNNSWFPSVPSAYVVERNYSPMSVQHHVPQGHNFDQDRPAGSSPHSFHSSPGAIEDGGSSSGSSNRSPASYASEPQSSRSTKPLQHTILPPIRPEASGGPGLASPYVHSHHQHHHWTATPSMPPPQRPGANFLPRTQASRAHET